jgi:hypothetical protein
MMRKEAIIIITIMLITIQTLIRAVKGCDICVIRNGTDVKPGIKPASSDVKEQTYTFMPLITLGGVTTILTVVLVKSKRKK